MVVPSVSRPLSRPGNGVLVKVTERLSFFLSSGAGGAISQQILLRPSSLLLAARLTGYQAIFDEARLDSVTIKATPNNGANAPGMISTYIERDPVGAIVATAILAADQRESVSASAYQPWKLTWAPQEPADLEFNLLNPGTTALGSFNMVGTAFGATVNAYTVTIVSQWTMRGRP